jgi:hypothetical protein
LPESSHPPAALTESGDAGSITCAPDGNALGAVDAGSDEGALVAATPDPDRLAAPVQPAMTTMIAAIATNDRVIG